jgi:SpoVK/Ycf46/Vps4 family AAA+-type ATPase
MSAIPMQRITTELDWEDLALSDQAMKDLEEIVVWTRHRVTLLEDWRLKRRSKPGFCSLFYGPPGTGKTLAAALLGKKTGLEVYRVGLSRVVSKCIGETEKNLARIFDQAEGKDSILFFDEADALFGKRTEVSDAHDRYASQELAYLLQRIEDYPGIAILASNLNASMDEAFTRRFQSVIHFTLPAQDRS